MSPLRWSRLQWLAFGVLFILAGLFAIEVELGSAIQLDGRGVPSVEDFYLVSAFAISCSGDGAIRILVAAFLAYVPVGLSGD